ncbi:MAG: ribosomal L7Ae/L30e/S12e/Gadd45 family protein [Desulfitobacteriaceae bacterium]|nr:ribosomal L7Ae/L30e/S12e/Gadd45 family protein [Desulfitobacteriaceae bacterium]MDI6878777.1 ribosomal L7Ae/L30e/S12e/Gadd45 family protein [Desulfitobacteriaceae bacterium]MDI6914966.1 ribosomal L7Ae/L30e/S12e/Gadd45 family protein [Desulfitobacteriaceae bacterium]
MLDESLKHTKNKTIGIKQTQRALEKGIVSKVYVARDAEAQVLKPIIELCRNKQIACIEVGSMTELGKACGIEVGAAVAAVMAE